MTPASDVSRARSQAASHDETRSRIKSRLEAGAAAFLTPEERALFRIEIADGDVRFIGPPHVTRKFIDLALRELDA